MTIDGLLFYVLAVVFVSTLVRTVFGFGNALVAMPLLAMTPLGIRTITPLVALISLVLGLAILIRSWKNVEIRSAWRLILATAPGIPLGTLLLRGNYERIGEIFLALIIVTFSGYSLIRPRLIEIRKEWAAYPFGFIAGILGGAFNSNGPPVVIYGTLRRWTPEQLRATLQGYFLPSSLIIVAGHGLGGLWNPTVYKYFLLSLPVTLFTIWLGNRLHRRIPPGHFDRLIHLLLIFTGAVLFIKAL